VLGFLAALLGMARERKQSGRQSANTYPPVVSLRHLGWSFLSDWWSGFDIRYPVTGNARIANVRPGELSLMREGLFDLIGLSRRVEA